jgi:hypothetical protein
VKIDIVEAWLRRAGWWWPPDAIKAVAEGRDTYHPLDPTLTYPVTDKIRRTVRDAIDSAARHGWPPGEGPHGFIASIGDPA